jgi:hypothetical protein
MPSNVVFGENRINYKKKRIYSTIIPERQRQREIDREWREGDRERERQRVR